MRIRKGIKDIWNSKLLRDASLDENGIPFAPTTSDCVPSRVISWTEAQTSKDHSAWVYFDSVDDVFDGPDGIWDKPDKAFRTLSKFAGVIGPVFQPSTYSPEAILQYNVYRSRAFIYWLGINGQSCINSVGWDKIGHYTIPFSGLPNRSILSINTLHYDRSILKDRIRFEAGLFNLVKIRRPSMLVVIGNPDDPFLIDIVRMGVRVFCYGPEVSDGVEVRIPEVNEAPMTIDLNAPIVPLESMAGIPLGTSIAELRSLFNSRPCIFEDNLSWYSYRLENGIRLDFLKKDDCLCQIYSCDDYKGTLDGKFISDFKVSDFAEGRMPGYIFDEDDEAYENKDNGVVFEFWEDYTYVSVRTKELAENENELLSVDTSL